MDITEIRIKYEHGGYTYQLDIPKKVPADHVFDEELSVKHNRELVAKHNEDVDRLQQYRASMQAELYNQLTSDVIEYIMDNYDLTEKQSQKVESFVYQEHHSCMYDYFCYIDTFATFAENIVNTKE